MLCHYASGYVGYIGYHGFIGLINPLLIIARQPLMLVGLDVGLGHLPKVSYAGLTLGGNTLGQDLRSLLYLRPNRDGVTPWITWIEAQIVNGETLRVRKYYINGNEFRHYDVCSSELSFVGVNQLTLNLTLAIKPSLSNDLPFVGVAEGYSQEKG